MSVIDRNQLHEFASSGGKKKRRLLSAEKNSNSFLRLSAERRNWGSFCVAKACIPATWPESSVK
ncbi:MAG: hypothetical protein MZV70_02515 [Desulfobacterales bacterium]|nr:hypothetical protein [Desulfobacterales bacterium]